MNFRLLIALLATVASTAMGQVQPWANQWLQHAYSAQAGRDYLGITNYPGAITNIASATNSIYSQFSTNWLGSNAMWIAINQHSGVATNKGVATLAAGVATVNTPMASLANVIQLTYVSPDGIHINPVAVSTVVPGVSFKILSSSSSDTANVNWLIVNP